MSQHSALPQNNLVSIVLPTYNQAKYLQGAIEAILTQTYKNFELIIVNDGSTDETENLLATIHHPQIHVITQANQGLPSALNSGFSRAKGEYWTWTSSDNIVSPNWLEELVNALASSPADVGYAFSYYAAIDDAGKILFINRDVRFDLPTLLLRHSGNASFLYRAELAKKVGNYDIALTYAEDLDMWVRMAAVTRAVRVESVLYYYRLHQQSMTTQQEKVAQATKKLVVKFLEKTQGKFVIDQLYPHINQSENPALERWKMRIWLATIGMNATFYCPLDALVNELQAALTEHYDASLVGNIVHFYAKFDKWQQAAEIVNHYQQQNPSEFLNTLANIISKQSKQELIKIPFAVIEEKYLATEYQGEFSKEEIIKNLANTKNQAHHSLDKIVCNLVNQLEDQKDHPEIWQKLASLQSPEEKQLLQQLHAYLSELITIPQNSQALMLLSILEAFCCACMNQVDQAITKFQQLNQQYPNLPALISAHTYVAEQLKQ